MFGFFSRLTQLEEDLKKYYATKLNLSSVTTDINSFRIELKQQIAKLRRHIAASRNRNVDIRRRLRALEDKK